LERAADTRIKFDVHLLFTFMVLKSRAVSGLLTNGSAATRSIS
jgi:hypothetical protein